MEIVVEIVVEAANTTFKVKNQAITK